MVKNKLNIFNLSGCLSREAILAWQERTLSTAEKYIIEKHLEECSLCKEAMEGLSGLTAEELRKNFAGINYAMQQSIITPKNKTLSRRLKLSLAAAIILALIGIFSVFKFIPVEKSSPVAQELTQEVIKSKSPAISSDNEIKEVKPQVPAENESVSKPDKSDKEDKKVIAQNIEVAKEAPVEEQKSYNEAEVADASQSKSEEPAEVAEENKASGYTSQPSAMTKKSRAPTSQGVRYEERAVAAEYNNNSETTFYAVEEQATFKGGDINKFKKYVEEKLNVSEYIQQVSPGLLTITFTVDKSGVVKDVFVVKGLDAKTDSIAIAIVKNSPKWKPAKNQGQSVNVNMVLPLTLNK